MTLLCNSGARFLQKTVYALSQCLIYDVVSLIARIHGSKNQWVDMGVVLFIIIACTSLTRFLLLVSVTLGSTGLEILVPKRGMFSPGDT